MDSLSKTTRIVLSLFRKLPSAQANLRSASSERLRDACWRDELCVFAGLGATALALARRLRALDAIVLGITRDPNPPKITAFGLDACFGTSDRSLCLPYKFLNSFFGSKGSINVPAPFFGLQVSPKLLITGRLGLVCPLNTLAGRAARTRTACGNRKKRAGRGEDG